MPGKKVKQENMYRQISFLEIEGKKYPVFFNFLDGRTYYLRENVYNFVDWNWTK